MNRYSIGKIAELILSRSSKSGLIRKSANLAFDACMIPAYLRMYM